jgi:hypothetical protein
MRPRKPNHSQDDLPRDPEILHWFRALGSPPRRQAPPDLRTKVLARITHQRARRGVWSWVPRMESRMWTAALAVALLLSVGLNLWWGIHALRGWLPGGPQVAETRRDDLDAAGQLSTYRFQVSMQRPTALGAVVAASPIGKAPSAVVGFTPHVARTTFFRMGTLYAETLAALSGETVDAAEPRLDLLIQIVTSVQAPRPLAQYLREVRTLLQRQQYTEEELATFLALFEPLYKEVYAQNHRGEALRLFQVGTWVENMALAAAVGDAAAVYQGGQAVKSVRRALAQLDAPPEVLEALKRLHALVARPSLTDRDLTAIHTLVQDVQKRLSE